LVLVVLVEMDGTVAELVEQRHLLELLVLQVELVVRHLLETRFLTELLEDLDLQIITEDHLDITKD